MRRTAVAELKEALPEILAAVRLGEEILIVDQGLPIARILPVSSGGPSEADIEALVKEGGIRRPLRPLDESFLRGPRPADPQGAVLAALLADREEGP